MFQHPHSLPADVVMSTPFNPAPSPSIQPAVPPSKERGQTHTNIDDRVSDPLDHDWILLQMQEDAERHHQHSMGHRHHFDDHTYGDS